MSPTTQTRTVRMTLAPELAAYLTWLDRHAGRTFAPAEYDVFAAGYGAAFGGIAGHGEAANEDALIAAIQAATGAVDGAR